MYTTIPTCIVCPTCGAALDWAPGTPTHAVDCRSGHRFPVHGGVIDLLGAPRPQSIAAWSNEWRITAWAYERLWRPRSLSILSGQPFPYSRELPAVAAAIPNDAHVILDLACSNGLYARTAALQRPQATVIGIDRSLPMLIDAQRRATAAQLAITYVR
ncbi:MAG: class I SAM-dependent methyltransferase, partial [Chloroflexi bacterium]